MQATAEDISQRLLESFSKFPIKVGVNDGVHGRVEIADPKEQVNDEFGRIPADDRADDVPNKKGKPAGDKGAHNYAQRFSSLVFSFHLADSSLGGSA